MTNKSNKVLYTGVTNDINRRVYEHKKHLMNGFTSKYNVTKLIYIESFNSSIEAIEAEKRIKGWVRQKKIDLINETNPLWNELIP